jgi:hypothetical protein
MKKIFYFLSILLLVGCSKDDLSYHEIENGRSIQTRNKPQSPQHKESDLNFILRAIHPSQNTTVQFGDGRKGARIQASVRVWKNLRTNGHLSLKVETRGWDFITKKAITRCENGQRIVALETLYEQTDGGRNIGEGIAQIEIHSTSTGDDDNDDCLIWDIKDSDGNAMALFTIGGNIFIDDESCQ